MDNHRTESIHRLTKPLKITLLFKVNEVSVSKNDISEGYDFLIMCFQWP